MADGAKVAEQLHKFFQAAEKKDKANAAVQTKYQVSPSAEQPPDRILKVYEEYLSKLEHQELADFDRIVEKMSRAV